MLGGATRCLEMEVGYARVRTAFGRPIGPFQAVKHKYAETFLRIAAPRAVEAFVHAAVDSILVHAGIGFTWEHDAHLYLRRAYAGEELLDNTRFHRELAARHLHL